MKPRELYSGQAPAAMSQMGQGLSEAGANIGRSLQQGYESLGKSIGQGITSAAGAYADYKSAQTSNSITKSLLSDPGMSKQLLGLDDGARQKLLDQFNQTVKDHGQVGGAQFSKQLLSPIQEYATIGRQYKQELDKIAAESSGRLAVGAMNVAPEWAKVGLEQQKFEQAASDKQRADATRQKALANFAASLKPSTPQQAAPAPAPTQSSSGSGIDLEHPTSFQNLSPEDKKRVLSTAFSPDIWNSFDAAARQEMLANPNHRIWRGE